MSENVKWVEFCSHFDETISILHHFQNNEEWKLSHRNLNKTHRVTFFTHFTLLDNLYFHYISSKSSILS